jgi:hypothetical protein
VRVLRADDLLRKTIRPWWEHVAPEVNETVHRGVEDRIASNLYYGVSYPVAGHLHNELLKRRTK